MSMKASITKLSALMETAEGDQLLYIELEKITVREQVRSEFDRDALAELAADIKKRGVQQPVIVREIETGYLLVAGERRLRASMLAGLGTIPAIVRELDEEAHEDIQFAENIQREDLSLEETAKAIRRRYDRLKEQGVSDALDQIAKAVSKSKSWVSKHLAATVPGIDWRCRQLLEKGITEDLELINAFYKLTQAAYAANDYKLADVVYKGIEAGQIGREEVRAKLKELKARKTESKGDTDKAAAKRKANAEKAQEKYDNSADRILWALYNAGESEAGKKGAVAKLVKKTLAEWNDKQAANARALLQPLHEEGDKAQREGVEGLLKSARAQSHHFGGVGPSLFKFYAYMSGATGKPFAVELILERAIEELSKAD